MKTPFLKPCRFPPSPPGGVLGKALFVTHLVEKFEILGHVDVMHYGKCKDDILEQMTQLPCVSLTSHVDPADEIPSVESCGAS